MSKIPLITILDPNPKRWENYREVVEKCLNEYQIIFWENKEEAQKYFHHTLSVEKFPTPDLLFISTAAMIDEHVFESELFVKENADEPNCLIQPLDSAYFDVQMINYARIQEAKAA